MTSIKLPIHENKKKRTSQRWTFAHWLMSKGRSRYDWIHCVNMWLTIVSDVGRTTSGSSSVLPPPWVTTASSGANPVFKNTTSALELPIQERLK